MLTEKPAHLEEWAEEFSERGDSWQEAGLCVILVGR